MKKIEKFYFDKKQMERIITEYLGITKEYVEFFIMKQLKKDIKAIIKKYKNDTRKIQYILASDLRYAYDNEEDIRIIEDYNGIIVYENLI